MSFDPWNYLLKIWKCIQTPTPKVGAHLGVWGFILSHFPTFPRTWNVTPELHFWPAPLQALALVVSPRLRLQQCICANKCTSQHTKKCKYIVQMFEMIYNYYEFSYIVSTKFFDFIWLE
jgi:hypothetical protein